MSFDRFVWHNEPARWRLETGHLPVIMELSAFVGPPLDKPLHDLSCPVSP